ncbi:hypothetical protein [Azospirillum sp.]|uniref:hypothetical protein n=1 Tax=Azospirillum sp. TaxID=34012 RepID=UPI0026290E68|nr:hypothetical protein [Azospirillum sp.]
MSEGPAKGIQRRKAGNPDRALRDQGKADAINQAMNLVHVTAVGAAREILDAGRFETRRCPVFGKNLVYFFIMRPAYRLRNGDEKSDQINRFPFVFICSPSNIGTPYHVYPFDTGGAVAGVFGDRPDPYVCLEDYELYPNLESAAAHIDWAFGSIGAYLDGELREGLADRIPHWKAVARGFLTIAGMASSRHNQPDMRASSIEVAYQANIPLKGAVKLAIIPKQFLECGANKNDFIIDKLNKIGVKWETYDWQPNLPPNEFFDVISEITKNYFSNLSDHRA